MQAKIRPLRVHENILLFYENQPTYNPQKWQGKPYKKGTQNSSTNYHISGYASEKYCSESKDGMRYPLSCLDFRLVNSGGVGDKTHPTQKPVDLLEYLIKTYTNEGELVLDNCIGSGSTAVACVNTGRNFIGFETDSHYCEIANKRVSEALATRTTQLF